MLNGLIEDPDNVYNNDSYGKAQENILQKFTNKSITNKSDNLFKKSTIIPFEDKDEESKAHLQKPKSNPPKFNSPLNKENEPIKNKQNPAHKDEIKSISKILSRELDQIINEGSFHQQISEKAPLKGQKSHT